MAHPQKIRDGVRRAYVHDRLSLDVAAAMWGVSYATAARWKKTAADMGDDWDKLQTAQLISGGGVEDVARQVLTGLVVQFQSTMQEIQTDEELKASVKVQMLASLADAYNKTVSASKRILPETSALATAMEVLQKQASFVREHYPQHAQAFAEILEPFGEELAKTLAN
ncbi:DUF1804 family protein [Pseudomonas sp. F1_0610]|uniref:DUF1804 family protein n=1 Tax=Pseudomonas sp. F1_0610 TaxID=3114284 RepID=UPI0039C0072B